MARLELTCADNAMALMELSAMDIDLYDTVSDEERLTVAFTVKQRDTVAVRKLAQRRGYSLRLIRRKGLACYCTGLLRRPVLCGGLALLMAVAVWLPGKVLFIRVEGNDKVPTKLILEAASECGIRFGASRVQVRSQRVKDELLGAIDGLDWAGVTTSGCVATITVSERQNAQILDDSGICSIVASRDGIVTGCTATSGKLQCRVGQAVKAGQLLISGYTDCGLKIQTTRAQGEIYAQTSRDLSAITPTEGMKNATITYTEKKYAVIIGKNRINLYKGSGISGDSCVKMYSDYYVTLPGGFQLPVVIVTEVWCRTELSSSAITQEQAQQTLSEFAAGYLPSCMIAGQIMTGEETFLSGDGYCSLQGKYACHEMIGQVRNEEIIKPNGNDY